MGVHFTGSHKAYIQSLNLKRLVNGKFELDWIFLSYSYLNACHFLWNKASGISRSRANVCLKSGCTFCFPSKTLKHLGFPCFLQWGKFFQGVGKINATWRYSCSSHESDEYLMISHVYRHSDEFVLSQYKHSPFKSKCTYLLGGTPGKMHWSGCRARECWHKGSECRGRRHPGVSPFYYRNYISPSELAGWRWVRNL